MPNTGISGARSMDLNGKNQSRNIKNIRPITTMHTQILKNVYKEKNVEKEKLNGKNIDNITF